MVKNQEYEIRPLLKVGDIICKTDKKILMVFFMNILENGTALSNGKQITEELLSSATSRDACKSAANTTTESILRGKCPEASTTSQTSSSGNSALDEKIKAWWHGVHLEGKVKSLLIVGGLIGGVWVVSEVAKGFFPLKRG